MPNGIPKISKFRKSLAFNLYVAFLSFIPPIWRNISFSGLASPTKNILRQSEHINFFTIETGSC